MKDRAEIWNWCIRNARPFERYGEIKNHIDPWKLGFFYSSTLYNMDHARQCAVTTDLVNPSHLSLVTADVPQDVVPDFDNFCLIYKRFRERKKKD